MWDRKITLMSIKSWCKRVKKMEAVSSQYLPNDRGEATSINWNMENSASNHNKTFHHRGGQILQKVFSPNSRVSIFVYTQNSSGHELGQPALADPALSRCWIRWSPYVLSHVGCSVVPSWVKQSHHALNIAESNSFHS